jgi:hypothetical protein
VATDIFDPDDPNIDPAMKATLAGEAARRVGASGIQVRTRNPFAGIRAYADSLIARRRRK